jgi:excisionase family DNA binding protein
MARTGTFEKVIEQTVESVLERKFEFFLLAINERVSRLLESAALPPAPMPELMSTGQFAEMLGVSKRSAQRLVARGEVEAVNVGGLVRVKRPSAARYVERGYRPVYRPNQLKNQKTPEPTPATLEVHRKAQSRLRPPQSA